MFLKNRDLGVASLEHESGTLRQNSAPEAVTLNERGYYDVGRGIRGARTDHELVEAIMHRKNDTVMVKYGLPWCKSCRSVLPHWVQLTRKFQGMDYVVASVENMKEAVKDINYSPHFAFFKNGRKVDEFYGTDLQRLHDRMWLHNDRKGSK